MRPRVPSQLVPGSSSTRVGAPHEGSACIGLTPSPSQTGRIMDTPAEKGCVAVAVPPDPHSKSLDPPPPYYPGVPTYARLPAAPQGQPTYPEGRSQDHVQLVLPAAPPPPPNDCVLWSLFNAMFCNFYCLGFAALAFSVKSRDQLVTGNVPAARRYGSSAQRLNLAALSVTIISIAFFLFGCYKNRLF